MKLPLFNKQFWAEMNRWLQNEVFHRDTHTKQASSPICSLDDIRLQSWELDNDDRHRRTRLVAHPTKECMMFVRNQKLLH